MTFTWLIIILMCSFLEVITVSLVSIWFIASGVVALIASLFTDSLFIQMSIFVLLGVFLLFTTRKPLQKMVDGKREKTNLERIYDMVGVAITDIKKYDVGIVKIDGKEWSAVSDTEILKGTRIKVLEINSTKLKVEKLED